MTLGAHQLLGQHGEQLAADFLKTKGYLSLGCNLRFRIGEIDLLMQDGETVVVVEVKTVRRRGVIDPIYKIGPAKQRKLWQLARLVASKYPSRNIRVDAVTLYWSPEPRLVHHQNVITP